ncbi:MAG: DoxX family protein [Phycisphaerae bacterium]|nr:DoxX family protein [Phycisphaerae bacterium]
MSPSPTWSIGASAVKTASRYALLGKFFPAAFLIGQSAVALIFVVAGTQKLYYGPGQIMAAFGALGWDASPVVAYSIAIFEVILGCWLATGRFPRVASWFTLICLILFSAMLVQLGQSVGWSEKCGCMGPFSRLTIQESLVRNGALIILIVALLISYRLHRPSS